MERRVKSVQHCAFFQISTGNFIKFRLDVGGKIVIDNLRKVVRQEIGNQFAAWRWNKFAACRASFFLDNTSTNFLAVIIQNNYITRLTFAVTLFNVAASLYSVNNRGICGWTPNSKLLQLLN